jgi:esterase/lipase
MSDMPLDKIEKLRQEIERLEAQHEQANFGSMFDRSKQNQLYKKIKKKKKELKAFEESA